MPLYDYMNMTNGDTIADVYQSIHDEALTEIDGVPVRRLVVLGKHAAKAPAHRAWIGQESRSVSLGLKANQIPAFCRKHPSWEFGQGGDAIFHDDQHMRKCLKEFNETNRVDEAKLAEEIGNEKEGEISPRVTDIPLPERINRSPSDG